MTPLLELGPLQSRPGYHGPPGDGRGRLEAVAGWSAVELAEPMFSVVVKRVVDWATQQNRTVELELNREVLEVTGVDRDDQKRLIDDWLTRQTSRG